MWAVSQSEKGLSNAHDYQLKYAILLLYYNISISSKNHPKKKTKAV